MRDDDLVVRLGGDEFAAVLVDEADQARAVKVAERLLQLLDDPVMIEGHQLWPAASVGVALSRAGEPDPVATLLRAADAALYAAKAGGRGRVCTADVIRLPSGVVPVVAQRSG